jgi:hypothetical protein
MMGDGGLRAVHVEVEAALMSNFHMIYSVLRRDWRMDSSYPTQVLLILVLPTTSSSTRTRGQLPELRGAPSRPNPVLKCLLEFTR